MLEARLVGAFRLSVDGRPVDPGAFERPVGLRLLKLLLVTPGHRIAREAAAELLAPEADPTRSRVNLRKAIHFARRALERYGMAADAIGGGVSMVELDVAIGLDVDADRLREAASRVLGAHARGRDPETPDLETLAELGGDELLRDEPYDEAWLAPRERLHRDVAEALLVGAERARAVGAAGLALRLVERLLQLEPAEEAGHRLAIELHVDAQRTDAARRQLLTCAAALADAYEVEPSSELHALLARPAPSDIPADLAARSIGAVLVEALVEAVAALAGDRQVAPASVDGSWIRPSRGLAAPPR